MRLEFRGRCPTCLSIRTITGFDGDASDPSFMDRVEASIDRRGSFDCHCPRCDSVESIAMFVDGKQAENWTDANRYERENGPDAGPLPPKPWEKHD